MGASALQEGIITEHTKILSTGVLRVPNPYHPGQYTTFKDWRTGLGYLDIRNAIRMSSSIFFYIIGGGHDGQPGLGISRIVKWANEFQFGQKTNIALQGEQSGVVPTPRWKKRIFGEDTQWTLGNTYHASIGQYGWLVTPIQAVKYIASIANGGKLYHPILTKQPRPQKPIHVVKISEKNFEIIREGMRNGARSGTAQALNIQDIHIAAKTGTAQLGRHNEFMNSWVVGYWPFDYSTNGTLSKHNRKTMEPQFAFAVVLEKGPAGTMFGAAPSMRPFFEWLVREHGDDYVLGKYPARVKDITTTNK
jgi:penicillin-binding protein 2